jgi:hypothetical protein
MPSEYAPIAMIHLCKPNIKIFLQQAHFLNKCMSWLTNLDACFNGFNKFRSCSRSSHCAWLRLLNLTIGRLRAASYAYRSIARWFKVSLLHMSYFDSQRVGTSWSINIAIQSRTDIRTSARQPKNVHISVFWNKYAYIRFFLELFVDSRLLICVHISVVFRGCAYIRSQLYTIHKYRLPE